jgi:hypothetical protein
MARRRTEEAAVAALRVGEAPAARWRWLTRFAESERPSLDPEAARNAIAEAHVFSLAAVEAVPKQLAPLPSMKDLPVLHADARALLEHVRTRKERWFYFPDASTAVAVWSAPGRTPAELTVQTMVRATEAADGFRRAMVMLLGTIGDRLRICQSPACGKPFVAVARRHQKFCTRRCQVAEALRHYIERHGGAAKWAKKRSEAYHARKTQKRKRARGRKKPVASGLRNRAASDQS